MQGHVRLGECMLGDLDPVQLGLDLIQEAESVKWTEERVNRLVEALAPCLDWEEGRRAVEDFPMGWRSPGLG